MRSSVVVVAAGLALFALTHAHTVQGDDDAAKDINFKDKVVTVYTTSTTRKVSVRC